ncbi:hypothetical protein RF11_10523 [Thelohanellus kitauei]|uniref:Uncharacterized protein n=1 Tax=Thelohanellus kitauei TaxID=669202 RepID=A0A0C2M8N4_THEKT|nr:hypothetical protein RF11_10523 [Thelohanellus kitauei]
MDPSFTLQNPNQLVNTTQVLDPLKGLSAVPITATMKTIWNRNQVNGPSIDIGATSTMRSINTNQRRNLKLFTKNGVPLQVPPARPIKSIIQHNLQRQPQIYQNLPKTESRMKTTAATQTGFPRSHVLGREDISRDLRTTISGGNINAQNPVSHRLHLPSQTIGLNFNQQPFYIYQSNTNYLSFDNTNANVGQYNQQLNLNQLLNTSNAQGLEAQLSVPANLTTAIPQNYYISVMPESKAYQETPNTYQRMPQQYNYYPIQKNMQGYQNNQWYMLPN